MQRAVLVGLLAAGATAHANGRPPEASTIHFRQGHETDIVSGLTFGEMVSHDGGASWHWMCEGAIGYGGEFDPIYVYTPAGSIFATTFDGLKANRDGCTFAATPPGTTFVSALTITADGALMYAAGDPNDSHIYKSSDDGMTFPQSSLPGINGDYWSSLVAAPTDPMRVYIAGWRYVPVCGMGSGSSVDACENMRVNYLEASSDGGAMFSPLTTSGLEMDQMKQVDIVGIDAAFTIYAVSAKPNRTESVLYRLRAGDSGWTMVFDHDGAGKYLLRKSGELVFATQTEGTWHSIDGGASWQPLVSPPHINCLSENAAGEVWACTQDKDQPMLPGYPFIPADGYGIMKSTDLVTWTPVMRFEDIAGPVDCAPDSAQEQSCVDPVTLMGKTSSTWCCVKFQQGITSDVIDCTKPGYSCGQMAPDITVKVPPPKGCCDASGGPGSAVLSIALAIGWRRRRRTRYP